MALGFSFSSFSFGLSLLLLLLFDHCGIVAVAVIISAIAKREFRIEHWSTLCFDGGKRSHREGNDHIDFMRCLFFSDAPATLIALLWLGFET